MRRLVLSLAATGLVAGSVLSSAGMASAGTHVKPTITATQATFTIPSSPTGVWQLGLTTYPPPVTHLGKVRGTSGTLALPVPRTATCSFQVDVKLEATGTSTFVLYSSIKAVVPGCGGVRRAKPGATARMSPTSRAALCGPARRAGTVDDLWINSAACA